jgi:hypothetical protein
LISTRSRSPPARFERIDLLFAGVHFRLRGEGALLSCFEGAPLAMSLGESAALHLAQVDCELEANPEIALPASERRGGHPIEWAWQGARGLVRARDVHALVERTGRAEFGVRARLPSNPSAAEALLAAVAPVLLHAVGGTVLHAACVELSERAVAFVGPSGAGKSTACRHTSGSHTFSWDRLAVAPGAKGWVACPLPGGKPSGRTGARSVHAVLPLAAILRVVQSQRGPCVEACQSHRRMVLLRQAALHGGRTRAAELELLAALAALGEALPVGILEFALGDPLRPAIERFIQGGSKS